MSMDPWNNPVVGSQPDPRELDPVEYAHIFRTMFGMPASKDDMPICGAVLPDSWDFPAEPRPECPRCNVEREALRQRALNIKVDRT